MESIIIRTTYDAKCLYSPNVREQLGTMARTGMMATSAEDETVFIFFASHSPPFHYLVYSEGTLAMTFIPFPQKVRV